MGGWSQQPFGGAGSHAPATTTEATAPRPWINQVGLNHYLESNHTLSAQPNTAGVVLMGDSITEFWKSRDPALFTDENYVDRGISRQTTLQILLRFRQDVVELHPAAVVILAGINDLAQNVGPESVETIEAVMTQLSSTPSSMRSGHYYSYPRHKVHRLPRWRPAAKTSRASWMLAPIKRRLDQPFIPVPAIGKSKLRSRSRSREVGFSSVIAPMVSCFLKARRRSLTQIESLREAECASGAADYWQTTGAS